MLGDGPLMAPWGTTPSRARPHRPWQVRRSSSPGCRSSSSSCSRWEPSTIPTTPTYLRRAGEPLTLRETASARLEGLEQYDAASSLGWFESFEPAVGLTPQELIERQNQRGKLAMLRLEREKEIARESVALKREKMAYARALGAAASSQAIEQMCQDKRRSASSSALVSSSSSSEPSSSTSSIASTSSRGPEPLLARRAALDDDIEPPLPYASSGLIQGTRPTSPMTGRLAAGRSIGSLAVGAVVSPECEKLHRGEPLVSPPSPTVQLERALERGKAAAQRRAREEADAMRNAAEQRQQRERARMLGSAASALAIEQMRQQAKVDGPPSPALPRKRAARAAFGSSSARCVTAASSEPRRAPSPARPVSPRLLRPTEAWRRSSEEQRAQREGGNSGSTPRGRGRPLWGSSQAARLLANASQSAAPTTVPFDCTPAPSSHANGIPPPRDTDLIQPPSPAEVYRSIAQQAQAARRQHRSGAQLPPAMRAASRAAANALVQASAVPMYAPTPSAAALTLQSGYRGMLGRVRARRERAARLAQRLVRGFMARSRAQRAKDRARLYSQTRSNLHWSRRMPNNPTEAALAGRTNGSSTGNMKADAPPGPGGGVQPTAKGRWGDRMPVSRLPVSKSLTMAPASPTRRPAHQRLHMQANERQERQRQRLGEKSEREELEHVATCTFSPMTNGREGRFKNVPSRIDTGVKKTPTRATSPARPVSPRIQDPTQGSSLSQGADEAERASAESATGDDEWTTVASTA